MKVNYDFYNGKDVYTDGIIEKDIINYLEKYGEEGYSQIFKENISWPVFYHITPLRKNIINWYGFKDDSEVLEIGAGMGAITSILCEKAKKVTAVELSKQRAEAIQARCKNRENLEIIVGNLNDIDFGNKKFDYITLIGVLEYAPLFTKTEEPFNDFLDNIKKYLKDDGKLLIAIENQFGIKYFAGAKEDHTSIAYTGITGYKNIDSVKTFGKEELKEILKKSGFNYTKFYYPMPDYKLPNVIFSDDYLPNIDNIEVYTPYLSNEDEMVEFNEKDVYKELIKNNQFGFFANSFFVEASKKQIETKIDLEKQKMIQIDKVMDEFYKGHFKIKQNNEGENEKKIFEGVLEENNKLKKELDEIKSSKIFKILKLFKK